VLFRSGIWFMNIITTEIQAGRTNMHWGAQRAPVSKAMKAAGKQASNGSITPVVMNAKTKKTDAAWQLVKYLASEEAGKIAASYLLFPGYSSPSIVDEMTKVKGFDPTAKDAINKSGPAYPMMSGANKLAGQFSSMVNKQLELLFTQNQTLDQTISEMDRMRKEIIANQ
jgi:ABC-type glycerol-3-phosphate transport system substrate-binding protein